MSDRSRLPRGLLSAVCVLFVVVLVRTAWIGDDAFITLRTVDNFTQGHGLRWNLADRVQTYTHPLWMLLLSVVYWPTRNPLLTVYLLSALCTAGALLVLVRRVACSAAAAALAVACLLASKAFVEFSTSGLENPLSHLLLAIAVWQAIQVEGPAGSRAFTRCSLAAGLTVLNRFDLGLLVAPLLLWGWHRVGFRAGLRSLLLGFTPLALWLLFAFVYYGSPLPITAYAKLNHGISSAELWANGVRHLGFALGFDPASVLLVLLGSAVGIARAGALRWAMVGALLYLLYLVKIGGDFMGTRFLAAPVLLAALAIGRRGVPVPVWSGPVWSGPVLATLLLGASLLIPQRSHLLTGGDWGHDPAVQGDAPMALQQLKAGADERYAYYRKWGLISPVRQAPQPGYGTEVLFPSLGLGDRTVFSVEGRIGERGYQAGPQVHFIDFWLCDPLLMRLPIRNPGSWRVGHFTRRIPEGYLETLIQGGGQVDHPGLAALLGDVLTATRAPIFAGERWGALWRLWSGVHDGPLADYIAHAYRNPPVREVAASALEAPLDLRRPWFLWDLPLMPGGGTRVSFPGPVECAVIRMGLATRCGYRVRFLRGDEELARTVVVPELGPAGELGMFTETDVPLPVGAQGFDTVWVEPSQSVPGHHRLGWILPRP